ncbi:MAG TPA: class I SAM-dependent methyltransferase [Armatimonadota bacterium]|jgi:predicted O-methyltransferase YrrM
MAFEYRSADWDRYRMDYGNPHREIEPADAEIAEVASALAVLQREGMLPHTRYDQTKFSAFRQVVRELFEIPWTAITPRMQRFIYSVNAIAQPQQVVAAGIFCGNTFISNAGAAVGPGACYTAERLLGVEIVPAEAERAERNVRKIDPSGVARIVTADAVEVVANFDSRINLLYLDADGAGGRGKGIYLDIFETAYDKMPAGSLVLAHNSVNCADRLADYLVFVRDPAHCRASVNVILDGEGLEVSVK